MIDQQELLNSESIDALTPELKEFLNKTRSKLRGSERRKFMAHVVLLMGKGGQFRAENELGWDRKTIRKGTKELTSGFDCVDNFSGRGRHSIDKNLPYILEIIKQFLNPVSQCDSTFRTTKLYSPLTAEEVHRRLIEDKGYKKEQLPVVRTIRNKLNQMGYGLKKVEKCKPKNK